MPSYMTRPNPLHILLKKRDIGIGLFPASAAASLCATLAWLAFPTVAVFYPVFILIFFPTLLIVPQGLFRFPAVFRGPVRVVQFILLLGAVAYAMLAPGLLTLKRYGVFAHGPYYGTSLNTVPTGYVASDWIKFNGKDMVSYESPDKPAVLAMYDSSGDPRWIRAFDFQTKTKIQRISFDWQEDQFFYEKIHLILTSADNGHLYLYRSPMPPEVYMVWD